MSIHQLSVRPLVPVAVGLIIGTFIAMQFDYKAWLIWTSFAASLFMLIRCKSNVRRVIWIFSISVFLGALLISSHPINKTIPVDELNQSIWLQVESVHRKKMNLQVAGVFYHKNQQQRVLIRLKEECPQPLLVGSTIMLFSKLRVPSRARVPHGFDYSKYLRNKNIDFISIANCEDIIVQDSISQWFYHFSTLISDGFVSKIDSAFVGSSAKGLMKGILLGNKNEISFEKKTEYARAGIGHVFAVSGMHVGMVYLLCWPLLYFRSRAKILRIILPLVSLVLVWLFIIASGLPPSAIRAGIMITLYQLSTVIRRPVDKWNILSVAAIISILGNPHLILDLGFQFSYTALIGIFFFYPRLIKLIEIKSKLLRFIYMMIAMSVSAQLALSPLILYYFGSISPYFWLNGFFSVIVVQINFILGLVAASFSSLGHSCPSVVMVVEYLFLSMDDLISTVMKWPGALIEYHLSLVELATAYSCLLSGMYLIQSRNWKNSALALSLGLIVTTAVCLFNADKSQSLRSYLSDGLHVEIVNDFSGERVDISPELIENGTTRIGKYLVSYLGVNSNCIDRGSNILFWDIDETTMDVLREMEDLKVILITDTASWNLRELITSYCRENEVQLHFLKYEYSSLTI